MAKEVKKPSKKTEEEVPKAQMPSVDKVETTQEKIESIQEPAPVQEDEFAKMINALQVNADILMSMCKQVGEHCRSKGKSGDRFFLAATQILRLKMGNFKA